MNAADAPASDEPPAVAKGTPPSGCVRLGLAQLWVDAALMAGSIWTLSCNLAYLVGWSLRTASLLSAGGVVIGTILLMRLHRCTPRTEPSPHAHEAVNDDVPDRADAALVAVAIIGLLAWAAFLRSYLWFWLISVPLLALGYWRTVRPGLPAMREKAAMPPRSRPVLLALLCAAAVFVTLVTRQISQDDCFYLNRAATLADGFADTMRTGYGILEKQGVPWPYPSYPLIAFHDFIGLLSWATDLQPLAVSAYIIAPAGAVLMILAYGLLCRALFGHRWAWALVGVFIVLAVGGPNVWHFANFGFPRIWQGKSLVLHVILPLVAVFGVRYGADGKRDDAVRLAGAATCAAGLSSISIWLVPAFAVLSVMGGIHQYRRVIPRVATVVAACAYPLTEGLLARGGFAADVGYRVVDRSFEGLMELSFGGKAGTAAWAAVVILAPLAAAGDRARRYLIVGVLGGLLTLMNPALFRLIIKHVTSAVVFWRVVWVLPPMAVLAASLLLAGFRVPGARARRMVGPAVWCLLAAAFAGLGIMPPAGLLAVPERIGRLGLKVAQPEYEVVMLLMRKLPPGSPVMAPEEVGWMIPTFRRRLGAIAPRTNVIDQTVGHQMGESEDAQMRLEALRLSRGLGAGDEQVLRRLVDRYGLRAVVIRSDSSGTAAASSVLRGLGFGALRQGPYVVWVRP